MDQVPKPVETGDQENSKVKVTSTMTIRRDFYQTDSDVVVNILAKNVDPHGVSVSFKEKVLEVRAKLADGQDYVLQLDLFGVIKPDECSLQVTKSKIEIKMRKDTAITWSALEAIDEGRKENQPTIPWSSKKDWNKLEKLIEKETKDNDDDSGNPIAQLYNSVSDDDTKRAMMKSMQESGGTVLSMNWKEVSQKKVERHRSQDEDND